MKVVIESEEHFNIDERINEYEMNKKLKERNIIRERVQIFRDFVNTLSFYIYETYLGRNYIKTQDDELGHFTWVFRKTCDVFAEEDMNFYDNNDIFDIYYQYFRSEFYENDDKRSLEKMYEHWNHFFDLERKPKSSEMESLIKLYKSFNVSFSSKKTSLIS